MESSDKTCLHQNDDDDDVDDDRSFGVTPLIKAPTPSNLGKGGINNNRDGPHGTVMARAHVEFGQVGGREWRSQKACIIVVRHLAH